MNNQTASTAAILTIGQYAARKNARLVGATSAQGETILVIINEFDHAFAAASSKISVADAYEKLAERIKAKGN